MSLDTYTNLKAEIADLLNRGDLTANIPTWIALVEAEWARILNSDSFQTSLGVTFTTSGTLPLPSDFLRPVFLALETALDTHPIAVKPYDYLQSQRDLQLNGIPRYAAFAAGTCYIAPIPDSDTAYTGTLIYDASLAALSATNPTNWVLLNHPDAYLYGAALHSAPFLKDDDRIQTWERYYYRALDQIRIAKQRKLYGQNTPILRPKRALGV